MELCRDLIKRKRHCHGTHPEGFPMTMLKALAVVIFLGAVSSSIGTEITNYQRDKQTAEEMVFFADAIRQRH